MQGEGEGGANPNLWLESGKACRAAPPRDNRHHPEPESPMKPTLAKELNHRLPSERRPDHRRQASPLWSLDLLAHEGRIRHHALSPDGSCLAFLWDRDGQSDMWLLDLERGRWPVRLTHHRPPQTYWNDAAPEWDRSGRKLLLEIEGEIWIVDARTGHVKAVTDYGLGAEWPFFSADGTKIFFAAEQDERDNLPSIAPEPMPGSWPSPVTRLGGDVGEPELSPAGDRIAFSFLPREDLDRSELCLVAAPHRR